jgi:putative transport protein
MTWFQALLDGSTVVGAVMTISLVTAAGLAAGSLRFRGVSLGVAGVLFAGLLLGHLGVRLDDRVLEFVREFGLILFVYTIGMQVGPGFLASLRRQGLPLNLMASAVVVLGVLTTVLVHVYGGVEPAVAVGLLSGATTNTPSLAAAQQALKEAPNLAADQVSKLPGLGYAVAYPFGIVGVILSIVAVRRTFRIVIAKEKQAFDRSLESEKPRLTRANLEVTNPNLDGMPLHQVPLLSHSGIVVSRIFQDGVLSVPQPETALRLGDVLLAVGSKEELDSLRVIVGRESPVDLRSLPSSITTKRLIVTHRGALGRSIAALDFARRFGVQITRVSRAEVEMKAAPGIVLQYGDTVLAVGELPDIQKVGGELGDSPKSLNYPHLIPLFVGIALGVLVGSWPFTLPGAPAPVKLGLAGGPLLVAIVFSRIGKIGPLVSYMPISANFMLREIGIVLFLAAVGLKSGDSFVATLMGGTGLAWMGFGAAITIAPLLVVGVVARLAFRVNYLTLVGLLAGSMTDPPALSFANTLADSEAQSLAYATVYPFTMILRILSAQLLVMALVR